MKCNICNKEIPSDSTFCSYCGSRVGNDGEVKKISLKCEHCLGTLVVDSDKSILACPYCGHQSLIIESDAVAIEKIRTAAKKDIELEKIKNRNLRQKMEDEKKKEREEKERIEQFKRGKFSKFLIIAFLIAAVCTYFNFSSGKIIVGIITLLQSICFAVSWTMGMGILNEKKRYTHVLVAIIGIVLVIPSLKVLSTLEFPKLSLDKTENMEEINWQNIFLREAIPEPDSKKIEIQTNTEKKLDIYVYNVTSNGYYTYLSSCKEMGYVIEMNESSFGYSAYNEEGYRLSLSHSDYNNRMDIGLVVPTEVTDLNWKEHEVAKYLPEPSMKTGKFTYSGKEGIVVIVAGNSSNDFENYKNECRAFGFSIDEEVDDDYFTAYDQEGYKVTLYYTPGNKEMKIDLDYPMQFKKIMWPIVGVGKLAPKPESLSACVVNDYGWAYTVYIENTTYEEYEAYVQKCIKAGFNKETTDYDDSFSADYSDDTYIDVEYVGFNIMCISVTCTDFERY